MFYCCGFFREYTQYESRFLNLEKYFWVLLLYLSLSGSVLPFMLCICVALFGCEFVLLVVHAIGIWLWGFNFLVNNIYVGIFYRNYMNIRFSLEEKEVYLYCSTWLALHIWIAALSFISHFSTFISLTNWLWFMDTDESCTGCTPTWTKALRQLSNMRTWGRNYICAFKKNIFIFNSYEFFSK